MCHVHTLREKFKNKQTPLTIARVFADQVNEGFAVTFEQLEVVAVQLRVHVIQGRQDIARACASVTPS